MALDPVQGVGLGRAHTRPVLPLDRQVALIEEQVRQWLDTQDLPSIPAPLPLRRCNAFCDSP